MSKRSIIVLSILIFAMMLLAGAGVWYLYRDVNPHPVKDKRVTETQTIKEEDPAGQVALAVDEPAEKAAEEPAENPAPQAPAKAYAPANPDGPFKVRNSATGKTNLLQRKDGNLSLTDETGTRQWHLAFDTPLAGHAQAIDFFHNGKLQYLFISGNRQYLIDRLGRFVDKGAASLAKPVLEGPAVYDFNKSGKLNIIVLNTDNTIDMYDLHGVKPTNWKGITASEPIQGLPEYSEMEGKSYWLVRTCSSTLLFGFYGGEPLKTASGMRTMEEMTE